MYSIHFMRYDVIDEDTKIMKLAKLGMFFGFFKVIWDSEVIFLYLKVGFLKDICIFAIITN